MTKTLQISALRGVSCILAGSFLTACSVTVPVAADPSAAQASQQGAKNTEAQKDAAEAQKNGVDAETGATASAAQKTSEKAIATPDVGEEHARPAIGLQLPTLGDESYLARKHDRYEDFVLALSSNRVRLSCDGQRITAGDLDIVPIGGMLEVSLINVTLLKAMAAEEAVEDVTARPIQPRLMDKKGIIPVAKPLIVEDDLTDEPSVSSDLEMYENQDRPARETVLLPLVCKGDVTLSIEGLSSDVDYSIEAYAFDVHGASVYKAGFDVGSAGADIEASDISYAKGKAKTPDSDVLSTGL